MEEINVSLLRVAISRHPQAEKTIQYKMDLKRPLRQESIAFSLSFEQSAKLAAELTKVLRAHNIPIPQSIRRGKPQLKIVE